MKGGDRGSFSPVLGSAGRTFIWKRGWRIRGAVLGIWASGGSCICPEKVLSLFLSLPVLRVLFRKRREGRWIYKGYGYGMKGGDRILFLPPPVLGSAKCTFIGMVDPQGCACGIWASVTEDLIGVPEKPFLPVSSPVYPSDVSGVSGVSSQGEDRSCSFSCISCISCRCFRCRCPFKSTGTNP